MVKRFKNTLSVNDESSINWVISNDHFKKVIYFFQRSSYSYIKRNNVHQ